MAPKRLKDYGLQSERLLWPTKGPSRFEEEMGADELERALGLTTLGKAVRWACEMGAPHQLQQRGWLRDTMKIGDVVTVVGSLARNGTRRANARTVTTADGKTLGAASSGQP